MNFFVRNVVLVHLAVLVAALSWIHGGTRPELLLPVIPWLLFFVMEFLLVFPQAKQSETLPEARSRTWQTLARDPLFYASILWTAYLVAPLFNVAGAPAYDAAKGQWVNALPPLTWLPSCVKPAEHAVLLLWFPPALGAALAAKHGLLKRGKRLLLEGLCWNGAALAVFGFAQQMTGAKSIYWGRETFSHFFSTFGYPNFAGAFFTLLFAISAGLWFGRASTDVIGLSAGSGTRDDESTFFSRHYLLAAALLNLCAALASLSRAAILLCAVVFVVLGVYMFAGVWQKSETAGRVKIMGAIASVLFLMGLFFMVFAPRELMLEVKKITPKAVVDRVSGKGYYHARMAKAIFSDHVLFGVGGWGYPHYLVQYLTPEDKKNMQIQGGANVHNDSLQFLAEHGALGFGLLLACLAALGVPLLWQSVLAVRMATRADAEATAPAKPAWLYRLPPEIVGVAVGATATVCHSFGDLPFRDPAILTVWVLALICATGYLPAPKRRA